MSRFYVPKEAIKRKKVLISGQEAHHILDVMRLKVSDEVTVFDGTGMEYRGIVRETGHRSLLLEIISSRKAACEKKHSITLIQAIPKKDKMDYIVEKATELGTDSIIPVFTARTIPHWSGPKKASVSARWQRIAQAAAKQCGRTDLPVIGRISDMEEAIKNTAGYDLKLMAALSDEAVKLKDILKKHSGGRIAIAIGPEGDFTPEEIKKCKESGFKIVNLGHRVLKSDTAGLAVLSMINYEYD